jgi:hypothetical protein
VFFLLKFEAVFVQVTLKKNCYIRHFRRITAHKFNRNRGVSREEAHGIVKKTESKSVYKNFLVNVAGRRFSTWQGTVTLTDRKATRVTRLPWTRGFGGDCGDTLASSKETVPFRSALELLHLISCALEEDEGGVREKEGREQEGREQEGR